MEGAFFLPFSFLSLLARRRAGGEKLKLIEVRRAGRQEDGGWNSCVGGRGGPVRRLFLVLSRRRRECRSETDSSFLSMTQGILYF